MIISQRLGFLWLIGWVGAPTSGTSTMNCWAMIEAITVQTPPLDGGDIHK
jgi:hypothetical protein